MASKKELLIVGLGNPGEKYSKTRHNMGFIVVDYLADIFGVKWNKSKTDADLAVYNNDQFKILLLKPTSYMNLSGGPVQAICSYYKILLDNVIVIHDDLDLETGRLKYKVGGGSAGHNGIKSIDQSISNNYQRIRIGIGKPQNIEAKNIEVSDYVLAKIKDEELTILNNAIEKIANIFKFLQYGNFKEFAQSLEHIAQK